MKNLRSSEDCHEFMKLVSRVYQRDIIKETEYVFIISKMVTAIARIAGSIKIVVRY